MISGRRLRAVLVFATVSAVAWAVLGTIVTNAYLFVTGRGIFLGPLGVTQLILAAFGFAAGTTWAVAVAVLPRRDGGILRPEIAALAGALGGLLVAMGIFVASGALMRRGLIPLLTPLAMMGVVGGTAGLLIQQVARRGSLPPAPVDPPAIEGPATHG